MFKKLTWAFRLLTARNYIVMTDRAAVINFEGKPASLIESPLHLAQQASALDMFSQQLDKLQVEHDKALDELLNDVWSQDEPATPNPKVHKKRTTTTKKAKKS